MARHDTGKEYPQVDEVLNLKICDLCGALNIVADVECVICRWRGHFERRPEVVRFALELQMQRRMASDLRFSPGDMVAPEDRMDGFGARFSAVWRGFLRWLCPRRY
jgi:hypothetical protein